MISLKLDSGLKEGKSMSFLFRKASLKCNVNLLGERFCLGDDVEVFMSCSLYNLLILSQGTLTLLPSQAYFVHNVTMEIICTVTVRHLKGARVTTSERRALSDISTDSTYFKSQPYVLLDHASSGGYHLFEPLTIRISAQLPVMNAPSSLPPPTRGMLNSQRFFVEYELQFTAHGNNCVLMSAKIPIEVRALYSVPHPERPLKATASSLVSDGFKGVKLTLFCTTDRTMYAPGDTVQLSYWTTLAVPDPSDPGVNFTRMTLSLKRQISSVPSPPDLHSLSKQEVLATQSLPMPPIRSQHLTHLYASASFTIPASAVPNFTLPSPSVISITNHLVLRLDTGSLLSAKGISLEIPIIVNGRSEVPTDVLLPEYGTPLGTLVCQEMFAEQQLLPLPPAQPLEVSPVSIVESNSPRPSYWSNTDFSDVIRASAEYSEAVVVSVEVVKTLPSE